MRTKVYPIEDRILVLPDDPEAEKNGIFIPDSQQRRPSRGTVVEVGSGKNNFPMVVKKGDTILYGIRSGIPVNIDEKEYLIMKEDEVFAVLKEE